MASRMTYMPKRAGFKALLNSPELCDLCSEKAMDVADRANSMFDASGYEVSMGRPGRFRAHAIVYTGDLHSMRSNRVHNTLLKAIG